MSNTVYQNNTPSVLREHNDRIRALERSGGPWIYVGTFGVDGVDDLITPDSPPFQNGWTNTLGENYAVAFTITNGWLHIRGGFAGGADGTVIFTLPPGYRPLSKQPWIIPTDDLAHYATVVIMPTGDVVFGTVI